MDNITLGYNEKIRQVIYKKMKEIYSVAQSHKSLMTFR